MDIVQPVAHPLHQGVEFLLRQIGMNADGGFQRPDQVRLAVQGHNYIGLDVGEYAKDVRAKRPAMIRFFNPKNEKRRCGHRQARQNANQKYEAFLHDGPA